MTKRHGGYIVTLAEDIREDDALAVINALRMVRGVIAVDPVPSDFNLAIAQQRADAAWRERLWALLKETR